MVDETLNSTVEKPESIKDIALEDTEDVKVEKPVEEKMKTDADEQAVRQAREAVAEIPEQPALEQTPAEEESPVQTEEVPAGAETGKKWYNPMTWFG